MGTQHMAAYQAATHPGAAPICVSEDPVGTEIYIAMEAAEPVVVVTSAEPARRQLPNWCVIVAIIIAFVILVAIFL